MKEGQELFEKILSAHRKGEEMKLEKCVEEAYNSYRSSFLGWAQKIYNLPTYYAAEVYQKTMIIFYSNIKDEKLQTLTSGLRTYIFGIGKRVISELRREDSGSDTYDEIPPEVERLDISYLERENKQHQHQIVEAFLAKLNDKCRRILELYYFHNFSMEAIAENFNYNGVDVAKKSKYECLKRLRKFAKGNLGLKM